MNRSWQSESHAGLERCEDNSMTKQIPVAEELFTWPSDSPQLIGTHYPDSGVTTFPQSTACPKTAAQNGERVLLPRVGTLWSWTIQGFLPKSPPYAGKETPKTFKPYGVGYVQLADEVIVESRLTTAEASELKIGMEMELVIIPFSTDDDGNELVTYAFAPVKK
jgi:uncharacterized OB-fold protein